VIATIALALALSAPPAAPAGDAAVREAYDRYAKALLAKDGRAAAAAVDRATIAYYGRVRDLALDGDATTVRKAPAVDKIVILRLRHQVGREAVERMDGAGVLAFGVENGWIDAGSVRNAKLGAVRVEGDSASGDLEVGGRVAPREFAWQFRREDGAWRISLVPTLRNAEPVLRQAAKQSGLDEDDFVLAVLEKVSDRPVPATIWDPLRPASGEKAGAARPR
jgi:hypothetical protein